MTIHVEIKYFCHKTEMQFCAVKGSLITLGALKGLSSLCASFTTPFRAIKNLCGLSAAQDSLLPTDNADKVVITSHLCPVMNKVNGHQESDSQLNRKGYNICVYEHSAITMTKQLKEKVIILNEPGRRTSLYQSC